jgi:TolB-like protein
MRVGITYAVVAWLIIQVAATTFGSFGIPEWAFRFVVIMLCVFFPVAIILAWAFELTPDGIKTTKSAQKETEDSKVHSKKRNWMAYATGAILPTLIFGILAAVFYFQAKSSDSELSALNSSLTASDKSIAVLPFTNVSTEPDSEIFATGFHDELLTTLHKIGDMKVISRTSVMQFKENPPPTPEIARMLDVAHVMEGTIQRVGDQIRINVQLINASEDSHIWAEIYTRDFKDVFALQTELAKRIAAELRSTLTPEEERNIATPLTKNLQAYELYQQAELTGTEIFDQDSAGLEEFQEVERLFDQAIDLDPTMAVAYAGRSLWHTATMLRFSDRSESRISMAESDALRAIELDPDNGLGYLALGRKFRFAGLSTEDIDFAIGWEGRVKALERARQEYRKALQRMPGDPRVWTDIGDTYRTTGDFEAKLENIQHAYTLDPLDLDSWYSLVITLAQVRRYDEALAYFTPREELDGHAGLKLRLL